MRAVLIHVATENPVKVRAVENALRDFLEGGEVSVCRVAAPLDLPKQPIDDQALDGATARTQVALRGGEADLGVGIDAADRTAISRRSSPAWRFGNSKNTDRSAPSTRTGQTALASAARPPREGRHRATHA